LSITPEAFDVEVGHRVRRSRLALKISQSDLASSIGLTFQQVQKYETGANRISCSKLKAIAERLGVRMSELLGEGLTQADRLAEAVTFHLSPQALKLAADFDRIPGPRQRRALADLAEILAEEARA